MNKIILKCKNGVDKILDAPPPGLRIIFEGDNNFISIAEGVRFDKCFMMMKSSCKVEIKQTKYIIHNARFFMNSFNTVEIGEEFSCLEIDCRLQENKTALKIGKNCMFSCEIRIYPTDGHAIYDLDNPKEAINPGTTIEIGDHVWIGRRVILLKGTKLSNNTIVGLGSIVTKPFEEENIVIGGYPAKILKRNVNWHRLPAEEFTRMRNLN